MTATRVANSYLATVTTDPEVVRACLELRKRVFAEEFGAAEDADEFDDICDHLAVLAEGEVVGTYRLLAPDRGTRLYSQSEFALDALATRLKHLSPPGLRVRPHRPWTPHIAGSPSYAQVPPLLRGYLRLGARVCGPPAHDPEFGVADFFTLLSFDTIGPRYRRYFLGDGE